MKLGKLENDGWWEQGGENTRQRKFSWSSSQSQKEIATPYPLFLRICFELKISSIFINVRNQQTSEKRANLLIYFHISLNNLGNTVFIKDFITILRNFKMEYSNGDERLSSEISL